MKIFLLLCLIICPAIVYAVSNDEVNSIQTEHDIVNMLKAQYLDDVALDWRDIDHHCLVTVGYSDRLAYIRCKYLTAKNIALFKKNSEACKKDAIIGMHIDTQETSSDSVGKKSFESHPSATIVTGQVAYRGCMRSLGWSDPDDWRGGHK